MNGDSTWPEIPAGATGVGRPRGWRRLFTWTVLMVWIGACAAVLVSHRARTVTLGYDMARASAERRRLLDERRSLELEQASLRSPLRVGVAAAQRMGLRPPAPHEFRRMTARPVKGRGGAR